MHDFDRPAFHEPTETGRIAPQHTDVSNPYQEEVFFLPDKSYAHPEEPSVIIPTRTSPHLTLAEFDSFRLEWGIRRPYNIAPDGERLGYDPLFPGYIIGVQWYADVGAEQSPTVGLQKLVTSAAASESEMYRLADNSAIHIPDHFYLVPLRPGATPFGGEAYAAYIYSEYIVGEAADARNPAHEPFILDIGEGTATYLESTPIGGMAIDEFLLPYQYIIGRPIAKPKEPIAAYMKDVDAVEFTRAFRLNAAEAAAAIEIDDDPFTYAAGQMYEWMAQLPPSDRRDALLSRLLRLKEHTDE